MCPKDLYEEVFEMTDEDKELYEIIKNMPLEEFNSIIENIINEDINRH